MKIIAALFVLLVVLTSRNSNSNQVNDLKIKVARLDNKVDSLIYILTRYSGVGPNTDTTGSALKRKNRFVSSAQCKAITRKGVQCSKKVRSNGYCRQHGG